MLAPCPISINSAGMLRPHEAACLETPSKIFWIFRFSTAVHNLYGVLLQIYYNFVILELRPAYHPGFFGSFDFPPPSTTSMVSY